MNPDDFSVFVELKTGSGRKTLCRAMPMRHAQFNHMIGKGEQYIVIRGWGAHGLVSLPICVNHSKFLFDRLQQIGETINAV